MMTLRVTFIPCRWVTPSVFSAMCVSLEEGSGHKAELQSCPQLPGPPELSLDSHWLCLLGNTEDTPKAEEVSSQMLWIPPPSP